MEVDWTRNWSLLCGRMKRSEMGKGGLVWRNEVDGTGKSEV